MRSLLTGLFASSLVAVGGMSIVTSTADAALITQASTVRMTVSDAAAFDSLGDLAQLNPGSFSIGETEGSPDRLNKGILKFELPTIPLGEFITSVTLKVWTRGPAIGTGQTIGNASLFHSVTDNSLDTDVTTAANKAMFESTAYNDTGLNVDGGILTNAAAARLVSVDVTNFILADYASDGVSAVASFRIEADNALVNYVNNGAANRFLIVANGEANTALGFPPVLEIVTAVPEPGAASILLAMSAAGMLARRRRA